MHSAERAKTLTTYLSSRLTSDEERRIKEHANRSGLSKSEWCRQAILRFLDTPPEAQLVLAEIMALRKIILALHLDSIHREELTEQRLRMLVEQAETSKHAMAASRIHAFALNVNAAAEKAPGPVIS
jgi:hypothetical protein